MLAQAKAAQDALLRSASKTIVQLMHIHDALLSQSQVRLVSGFLHSETGLEMWDARYER